MWQVVFSYIPTLFYSCGKTINGGLFLWRNTRYSNAINSSLISIKKQKKIPPRFFVLETSFHKVSFDYYPFHTYQGQTQEKSRKKWATLVTEWSSITDLGASLVRLTPFGIMQLLWINANARIYLRILLPIRKQIKQIGSLETGVFTAFIKD